MESPDPAHALWDVPTATPGAANSITTRAIFVDFSPGIRADQDYQKYNAETKDLAGCETQLKLAIANIQAKYPSVKEIDILTLGRAALQAVADASNGMHP